MRVGRRTTLALLAAIVVVSLLVRYPRSEHEVGVDSFFVHTLGQSIVANGRAEWILNPFSFFGWYPLSYPSAVPFLLGSSVDVGSVNLEASILLIAMMLGPIGILGAFLMAREFRHDPVFALAVAFLYGMAPRFLSFSMWSASSRSLFMALLPALIWALLLYYRHRSILQLAILAVTFTLLTATHRLAVLLSIVFVSFLAAAVVLMALRILRLYFPRLVLQNSFRRVAPHLALLGIIAIAAVMLFGTNVLDQYTTGELASGTQPQVQIFNLGISIARSSGVALPLTLAGLVVTTRQWNKTLREPFLALSFLGFIPTLLLRDYAGFYVLPILAILGGLGFWGLIELFKKRPRVVLLVAVTLTLVVASFSTYVLGVEVDRTPEIASTTYDTSLYGKMMGTANTIISNEGLTGVQFASISGARILPVGGAGTSFQSPELLAFGFFSGDEVNGGLVRVSIQDLTIESDSIWVAPGIQAERDWVLILQSPGGNIDASLDVRYAPGFLLELKSAPGQFLAYDNVYCSELGLWAHQSAYEIYDNGRETIWLLHLAGVPKSGGGSGRCGQ